MIGFGRVPIRSRWFQAWVAVAAAGLIVGTALWTIPTGGPSSSPTPAASAGVASSAAPGTAGSGPSAGSGPATGQAWEPFVLAPEAPVADLVATRLDAAGVETGTWFRLTSRTTTSAAELASRLEVSPAVALRVAPGAGVSEAIVKPVAALTPGTSYRFRIRTDAGTVAASWLFQAKQPLHVVTTIPADQATDVPVGTGIEATFDQDEVTGYTNRVRIEPAVPFELEVEGRSLAIVPQRPLAERTLYTVTIGGGIGVRGSDVTLERDVVLRFETGGRETSSENVVALMDTFDEVSPAEVPVLGTYVGCAQGGGTIDQDVVVYRLPSTDAAVVAARSIASGPSWAAWSDAGLVPTGGLPSVMRMTTHVDLACDHQAANVITFPSKLPAASYLVVLPHPGRDSQLLLQVTPLALYTSVSDTRSLAWVNDTVTGKPVADATVRVAGGSPLGRTNADGLLVIDTPAALASASAQSTPIVVASRADGGAVLSVLGPSWSGMGTEAATARYWLDLETDRQAYRSSDTIRAWGVIRPRDGGSVPTVDVRLLAPDATADAAAPAIAHASASPDAAGAFSVSLTFTDLPLGSYQLVLVADGRVAVGSFIQVDEIRKPAYRIDVTVDRHVLVAGDKFTATARVAYFDGTPVPALDLAVEYGDTRNVTTDTAGVATIQLTARWSQDSGDPTFGSISVKPVHPEEGTITGGTDVRVYRAAVWPTSEASATAGTLQLAGRLQVLDLAGLERTYGTDEPAVEGGAPVTGGSVQVSVVRLVQHQKETGRTYDWIAKQTVPVYEGWTERVSVLSTTRTADAEGRFSLTVALPDAAGEYETKVTARDPAGRTAQSLAYVDASVARPFGSWPWLATAAGSGCCDTYAVGDPVALHVEQPVGAQLPGADRFLFAVAQRGLREAVVGTSDSFERPFSAADVPSVTISAVEFTGRAYVVMSGLTAQVRQATEAIAIELSTDAAAYRPGADAKLAIRTTGPDGKPTSATVFAQAVDEKLYRIDAASSVDLLTRLYAAVPDGIRWTGATHAPPSWGGGRGDTTGGSDGGVRADFKDTLFFRQVTTDASGRATIPFTLADDLTSWRVTAAAVDQALHAGTASIQVPVGLPFFVETTLAPEYLVSDKPVLQLRAYGSSLAAGQAVRFTVTAPSLGLAPTTVAGTAFKATGVALPGLSTGSHRIQIAGTTLGRTPALTDSLVRTVRVVASRYEELSSAVAPLDAAFRPIGGDGLTTYVIADAGQATLAAILEGLLWSDGARVDQALGAAVAHDILVERFGREASTLPATRFEAATYQRYEGIALLPYAGVDATLTTRIALAAPERFDLSSLRSALQASYGDPFSTGTRERGIIALAGLAALGEPVVTDIDVFARQPSLTVRERLYLGIAYAEVGDDTAARAIERDVLATHGRQLGPVVRLDVSPARDDIVEATGLLAILAAAIGDPVADRAQAYLEANPPKRTLQTLEELAFVRHSLDRLAPEDARFAYTVDGTRHVVDLASERSFALTLTAAQRASLRLERLAGDVSVTTSWLSPARPGASPADPDVRIVRTVSPGLAVGQDQMVRVRLTVSFASAASDQCYAITERVPSGLAPLPRPDFNAETDAGRTRQAVIWPDAVTGQLVSFCASPVARTVVAIYSARVVTPGTYTWEPATISASAGTGLVSLTGTSTLTVR